jgi:arylformamidase
MEWIDVTLPMLDATVHWPGHPRYTVTEMMAFARGDNMNVSAVAMCSHFGTHIDAPRHYVPDGTPVDLLSPDVLIGLCLVVEYPGREHVPAGFIESLDLSGITRLLIRTRNSLRLRDSQFYEDFLALTPAAAQALVDRGVRLLGVDGYSIGPFDPALGYPVHSIFLGAGPDQVAIEEVDLLDVSEGHYYLIALPLRLTGLEGSPARVLLGKK